MPLEDYFEFEKFDTKFGPVERIRIKGHRISIEDVLQWYRQGATAEEIARSHYPSLTLDQVNAVISYYVQNTEAVDAYLKRGEEVADGYYQEYLRRGPYWLKEDAELRRAAEPGSAGGHE